MDNESGPLFVVAQDGEMVIIMEHPAPYGPARILDLRTGQVSESQEIQVFFKWGVWEEIIPPRELGPWEQWSTGRS